jgi:1-acyl-sn-glycerol-3-phosphate acyltransferase
MAPSSTSPASRRSAPVRALLAAYSVVYWAFFWLSCVVLFLPALAIWLVTARFDRRRVVLQWYTCLWSSIYTWINPLWPLKVRGREKIDRRRTYVIVANHQSQVDIAVIFRLRTHFKFVSKAENFRVPFIGWNMRMNNYIPVSRGERESVVEMMRRCRDALNGRNSLIMFPEGTRGLAGEMAPFKPGAFELAKETGNPVLPVAIKGTGRALPRRSFFLRGRFPLSLTVLDPIEPDEAPDPPALAALTRERIAEAVGFQATAPSG